MRQFSTITPANSHQFDLMRAYAFLSLGCAEQTLSVLQRVIKKMYAEFNHLSLAEPRDLRNKLFQTLEHELRLCTHHNATAKTMRFTVLRQLPEFSVDDICEIFEISRDQYQGLDLADTIYRSVSIH